MPGRLRSAVPLAQLRELMAGEIRQRGDCLRARLMSDEPSRKFVSPAVTQDRIIRGGVHRPYRLPA